MSDPIRFMKAWNESNYLLASLIALESPGNIFKMTTPDKWPQTFSIWMNETFDKITDLNQLVKVRQMFLEISKSPRYKEYCETFLVRTDTILFMRAWQDKQYFNAEQILITSPVLLFDIQIPERQFNLSDWIEERLDHIKDLKELWTLHDIFLRLNEDIKFSSDGNCYRLAKKIASLCGPLIIRQEQALDALKEQVKAGDVSLTMTRAKVETSEKVMRKSEGEIIQLQKKLSDQSKSLKTLESMTSAQSSSLSQQESVIRDRNQEITNLKKVREDQMGLLVSKDQKIAGLEKKVADQSALISEKMDVIGALDETIERQSGMLTVREKAAHMREQAIHRLEEAAHRREESIKKLMDDIGAQTRQRFDLETFVFQFLLSPPGYAHFLESHDQSLRKTLDVISKDAQWSLSFKTRVLAWLLETNKLFASGDRRFVTYLSESHPLIREVLKEYFTEHLECLIKENKELEREKALRKEERGVHIVMPFVGTLRPFDSVEYATLGQKTDALKPEIDYCQSWVNTLAPVLSSLSPPLLLSQMPEVVSVSVAQEDSTLKSVAQLSA